MSSAQTVAADSPRRYQLFIDGKWVDAESGKTFETPNPATGATLAEVAEADKADIDKAVIAARRAFEGKWSKMSARDRGRLLYKLSQLIEANAPELAALETADNGKPIRESQYVDIPQVVENFEYFAGYATKIEGETIPVPGQMFNYTLREPLGVCGQIIPWNFPLLMAAWKLAPALAAGNTIVLKPAEQTPVSAMELGKLIQEAGFPDGVVNIVPGYGETAGAALASHPGIDKIAFTGSTEVGKIVAREAAQNLTKVSLELGGNAAFVVLDDADIDMASMVGAWSTFHYQGQTCITANRHIVLRSVADAYVAALTERARNMTVGDPSTDQVSIGPIISEAQRDRAHEIVQQSIEMGAELVEGGTYEGLFYRPTVLVGVTPDMPAFQKEIFAPVAPITVVDTEEEALELTNRTEYGLASAVYTGDLARGLAFAEKVRAGMVHVNDAVCLDEAHVPFGGMGASGLGGRSGGEANLDEFTERRWISLQRTPVHYPY